MHGNPFLRLAFIEYLIGLTIGPVFIAAAIYLCFSRIVVVYDPEESFGLLRHRSYMLIFCACDILSLVLQSVGGAGASLADTQEEVRFSLPLSIRCRISHTYILDAKGDAHNGRGLGYAGRLACSLLSFMFGLRTSCSEA